MDTKALNARKEELFNQQELVLNQCQEAKVQPTRAQLEAFDVMDAEIAVIEKQLKIAAAIDKGRLEIAKPTSNIVLPTPVVAKGKHGAPPVFSEAYCDSFWNALKSRTFSPRNDALSEGGAAGDGGFLVPIRTDPTIPALAILEASARKLSRVIPTEMDIKLNFQASRSVAAPKAESTASSGAGANAFPSNAPTFGTTTLSAFMAGDSVYVSWELLQDVTALEAFVTADLNRAVFNYEETMFINGTGDGEPLGYLNGAVENGSDDLSIDAVLDLTGDLNPAYYPNAKFLMHRKTLIAVYKAQIVAGQFQQFISYDADGTTRLLTFPVNYSAAMPYYSASPATTGAILFGDFAAGWTIGDRGGSAISVKVLDQVAALNGQTVLLAYRRTDQRNTLQEAVQQISIVG